MTKDEHKDYIDWEKKRHSKWAKVSKQIKPIHVIGIAFLIFAGQYLVSTGKIQVNVFWGILFAFGILFFFLMFRETSEPKLIPEHIIKQIASEALEKKRLKGDEIPFDAKIKVTLVGEVIHETDIYVGTSGIIKREVGFKLIRKGLKETGVIGVHPYNGAILGIRWEKLGYTGKETKDRTIVPVGLVEQPKGS